MAIESGEIFDLRQEWRLLFTKNDRQFIYKRYWNRDQIVLKPVRLDWFLRYYFWQFIATLTMLIIKPLYKMYYEHFRYKEGEEVMLGGREMRFSSIRYYLLK